MINYEDSFPFITQFTGTLPNRCVYIDRVRQTKFGRYNENNTLKMLLASNTTASEKAETLTDLKKRTTKTTTTTTTTTKTTTTKTDIRY